MFTDGLAVLFLRIKSKFCGINLRHDFIRWNQLIRWDLRLHQFRTTDLTHCSVPLSLRFIENCRKPTFCRIKLVMEQKVFNILTWSFWKHWKCHKTPVCMYRIMWPVHLKWKQRIMSVCGRRQFFLQVINYYDGKHQNADLSRIGWHHPPRKRGLVGWDFTRITAYAR